MKKLHKHLGIVLMTASLVSTTVPIGKFQQTAYAESISYENLDESLKTIIQNLKQLAPELRDFNVSNINVGRDDMGAEEIQIHLSKNPQDQNASAMLNLNPKTGELNQLFIQTGKKLSLKGPEPAIARAVASTFLQGLLGESFKDYKMSSNLINSVDQTVQNGRSGFSQSTIVTFYYLVKGVPFRGKGYTVIVDSNGQVVQLGTNVYHRGPVNESLFSDPSKAITKQAAEKEFGKSLELYYNESQPIRRDPATNQVLESKPVLAYGLAPTFTGVIDALTGKQGNPYRIPQQTNSNLFVPVASQGKKLSAKSSDQIAKIAGSEFGLATKGAVFKPADVFEMDGRKLQNYVWSEVSRDTTVTTVAATGQIVGFRQTERAPILKPMALSKEAAQKTAVSFIQKYLDKNIVQLRLKEVLVQLNGTNEITFMFDKSFQGVPVINHSYEVTVNTLTGKVTGMSGVFDRKAVVLPPKQKAVSREIAAIAYTKQHPLELVYVWPGQQSPTPHLVYAEAGQLSETYLDAITGKPVAVIK